MRIQLTVWFCVGEGEGGGLGDRLIVRFWVRAVSRCRVSIWLQREWGLGFSVRIWLRFWFWVMVRYG